jgi:hypothetical protein
VQGYTLTVPVDLLLYYTPSVSVKKHHPRPSPHLRKERRYAPAAAILDTNALASSIATPRMQRMREPCKMR